MVSPTRCCSPTCDDLTPGSALPESSYEGRRGKESQRSENLNHKQELRFESYRDSGTVAPILAVRPDSEQLFRCPCKIRIVILVCDLGFQLVDAPSLVAHRRMILAERILAQGHHNLASRRHHIQCWSCVWYDELLWRQRVKSPWRYRLSFSRKRDKPAVPVSPRPSAPGCS